jgi:hypothetical protein
VWWCSAGAVACRRVGALGLGERGKMSPFRQLWVPQTFTATWMPFSCRVFFGERCPEAEVFWVVGVLAGGDARGVSRAVLVFGDGPWNVGPGVYARSGESCSAFRWFGALRTRVRRLGPSSKAEADGMLVATRQVLIMA